MTDEIITIMENGYHKVWSEFNSEYVTSCYLQLEVRKPNMGYCRKCKKELASIEVGSWCFDCRGIKWDDPK